MSVTTLKVKTLVAVQYQDLSEGALSYKLYALGVDGYVYSPDSFQDGWRRADMTIVNPEQFIKRGRNSK